MLLHLLIVIQTAALVPLLTCQQLAQNQSGPDGSDRMDSLMVSSSNLTQSFSSTTSPTATSTADPLVVSPSEQQQQQHNAENGSSNPKQPDPTFYYGGNDDAESRSHTRDDQLDGSDLNFSLMNAPHERIQAVQNLLSSQQQQQQNMLAAESVGGKDEAKPSQYHQTLNQQQPANSGLQCTHKGRQYLHGQSVPIEEQPCLNCTCRRAVLQCFLRVCPPVISLEATRKRMQQQIVSSGENDNAHPAQHCRMVKEPSQCCPTLRCETPAEQTAKNSSTTSVNGSGRFSSSGNGSHNSDASIVSLVESESHATARAKTNKDEDSSGGMMEYHLQQQQQHQHQSMINRSTSGSGVPTTSSTTTVPTMAAAAASSSDEDLLPKLTVINGASGQRDSILLITSNPNSHHHHGAQTPLRASENGTQQQLSTVGRQDYAHALMEALLETVYSSAAQLQGLNLQGSCMINGSLYVEGSAVIPEGNAICQYCYCIRQKIMCVRPKCHLIISGCSPKYSNEYACCPTSYSCNSDSNNSGSGSAGAARLQLTGNGPARLSANDGQLNQQSLATKLWAALESVGHQFPSQTPKADTTRSLNQQEPQLNPATMLALMNSAAGKLAPESSISNDTTTTLHYSNVSSTTPASTTSGLLNDSSAGNHEDSLTNRNRDNESSSDEGADEDGSDASGAGADQSNQNDQLGELNHERAVRDKELTSERNVVARFGDRLPASTNFNTTTEQPSSVSDFLEPMNKLGPLVVSPTAPSGCVENNRQYAIGEQIPTLESCKHCYCGLEGLKECKMIECSLKVAHNCRPITPEGHCCPIRYECPAATAANSSSNLSRSRYRSEDPHTTDENHTPVTTPFTGTTQCKSDLGEGDDCQDEVSVTTTTTTSATPDSSPAHVPVEDAPPVFITTRLLPESDHLATTLFPPAAAAEQTTTTTTGSSSLVGFGENLTEFSGVNTNNRNESASLNLTEELNKFIMQIKQSNGGTTRGTDYSLVPAAPAAAAGNETSQEMMINDQHARMVDYHSVQAQSLAPPSQEPFFSTSSVAPPPLPDGIVGIPSIRVEPVNEGSLPPITTEPSTGSQLQGGQRDSRSTNGEPVRNLVAGREPEFSSSSSISPPIGEHDQPDSAPAIPEYLVDQNTNSAGNSAGPMGANLTAADMSYENLPRNNQTSGSTMVDFDDDLGGNADSNSGFNVNRGASSIDSQLTNIKEVAGTATTGNDIQSTTGTPIGLEADRSPETSGWLQSLSGVVRSFGRRFTSSQPNQKQQVRPYEALMDSSSENSSQNNHLRAESQEQLEHSYETARSGSTSSLLDQLFKSVIGGDATGGNEEMAKTIDGKDGQRALIMRPLAAIHSESSLLNRQASDSGNQANEPIEIVTAVEANEPEIFTQPSPAAAAAAAGDASQTGSAQQFSRRSDMDDDLMSMASTTAASTPARFLAPDAPQSLMTLPTMTRQQTGSAVLKQRDHRVMGGGRPAPKVLTCYELSTNRTFQPNEIIPKNDPCKTCTCVLGEELCQNLVCPEKPGENCSEERRAGECCPSYLCGNNVAQFASNVQPAMVMQQQPPARLQMSSNLMPSARLLATTDGSNNIHRSPNLVATQRAMNVDSAFASLANGLDQQRQAQQQQQQQPPRQQNPQQQQQFNPTLQQQQQPPQHTLPILQTQSLLVGQNRARIPVDSARQRQQHLPQHPIRTSDLASILPPHLRFRPNLLQGGGSGSTTSNPTNLLTIDRNKQVLFSGPAQRLPEMGGNQAWRNDMTSGGGGGQPSFPNGAWGQFNSQRTPGSSPVGPQLLLAPQRSASGQQVVISNLSQPFRGDEGGFNFRRQQTLPMQPAVQQQRPSLTPTSGGPVLPHNVLMSRMNGGQHLSTLVSQSPPANTNAEHLPPGGGSNSWQPNSGSILLQSSTSTQSTPLIFKNPPIQVTSPAESAPKVDLINQPVVSTSNSRVSDPWDSLERKPIQKVEINAPVNAVSLNTVDTDLAITPDLQRIDTRVTSLPEVSSSSSSTEASTTSATSTTTSQASSSTRNELSDLSSTTTTTTGSTMVVSSTSIAPETTPQKPETVVFPDQTFLSTQQPSNSRDEFKPETSTRESEQPLSRQQPPAVFSSESTTMIATSQPEVVPSSTLASSTTTTSTTTTAAAAVDQTENMKVATETQESSSDSSSSDQSSSNSQFDPLAMFRVSECNIYGRIYKVGQAIEELSDVCKRCTCTQMGVDCQRKC